MTWLVPHTPATRYIHLSVAISAFDAVFRVYINFVKRIFDYIGPASG